MSSDTSSMPDIEEYMASICDQNSVDDTTILNSSTSSDHEGSSDEVEIIGESKVDLENHDCSLCCEGAFLVKKLLQFGGVLNDEHKHACDLCFIGFKTRADANKHKKLHEDGLLPDDPSIQDLTSVLNLSNSHEISASMPPSSRKKKNNSTPVVCDICCKILKSEKTLETHKRNLHSNITYACEVCDAKFSKFREFKKHCATHKDSKSFLACPTCKKQFLYKTSLKKHVCALKT